MSTSGDQRIRCLHFLPEIDLEAGGVVRAVIDMVQALADAGAQVTLLTNKAKDCPAQWMDDAASPVRVVTLSAPGQTGLRLSKNNRQQLHRLIAEHDLLHLHTPWNPGNLAIASLANELNTPYIVSLHGMLDDWCMTQRGTKKRIFLKLFARKFLERAAFVHCTASGEQEQSEKWYPKGTTRVIPLVVDLSPYDPSPTADQANAQYAHLKLEGIKLLFLSRIHPKKGLGRLIRAGGILQQKGIAFQLGIAGPGDTDYVDEMKRLASQEGIADRTHFLGMVRGSMKLSLFCASDVFVLPTSQENFGLVYPEAMLCSTPIIGTKGTDIWRELEQGGGVICSMSPEGVAEAIERLSLMPAQELSDLGNQGRDYVQAWLDTKTIAQQYLDAYSEVASQDLT